MVQQAFEDYRRGAPERATEALAWLLAVAPGWLRWAGLVETKGEGAALVLERLARERGGELADLVAAGMDGLAPGERRAFRAALLAMLPATVALARVVARQKRPKRRVGRP